MGDEASLNGNSSGDENSVVSKRNGSTDDPEYEFNKEMETWRTARALLRKSVASPPLPCKNPGTGEDVKESLKKFECAAERGNALVYWTILFVVPTCMAATF